MLFLKRWRRLYPDELYVVERVARPGKPVGDIGQALDGACKRAKVDRIIPHTLKHTAITLFISGGGDPHQAADYFSTTYETIRKNYLHLHPDHQAPAMATVTTLGKPAGWAGTKWNETPGKGRKRAG